MSTEAWRRPPATAPAAAWTGVALASAPDHERASARARRRPGGLLPSPRADSRLRRADLGRPGRRRGTSQSGRSWVSRPGPPWTARQPAGRVLPSAKPSALERRTSPRWRRTRWRWARGGARVGQLGVGSGRRRAGRAVRLLNAAYRPGRSTAIAPARGAQRRACVARPPEDLRGPVEDGLLVERPWSGRGVRRSADDAIYRSVHIVTWSHQPIGQKPAASPQPIRTKISADRVNLGQQQWTRRTPGGPDRPRRNT